MCMGVHVCVHVCVRACMHGHVMTIIITIDTLFLALLLGVILLILLKILLMILVRELNSVKILVERIYIGYRKGQTAQDSNLVSLAKAISSLVPRALPF